MSLRISSGWIGNARLAVVLAALAAALVTCAPAGEEDGSDASAAGEPGAETAAARGDEVDAVLDDFVAAWEQEDVEAATGMFTADGVAFDPVPPGRFHRTEGIESWIRDSFVQLDDIDIALSERTIQTHGDVAWFESRYVFAARPAGAEGEPFRDEGFVTVVLVKQEDGSYRIPLFHASPLPEAMPEEGMPPVDEAQGAAAEAPEEPG